MLQAVHLADNYLRFNPSCQPAFVRIIYAMALEISIKLNEQMVLSLEDIEALFENRFSTKMLVNLERHILSLNNFRTNVATPLDYVLNLLYLFEGEVFTSSTSMDLPVDEIANDTLYLLHYALSQYNLSRKKYSSIAIAAICTVLQDAHFDMYQNQMSDMDYEDICEMQKVRDTFLTKVKTQFGDQIDLGEIYEILREFKQPFKQLQQNIMMDG